ncbi:phage tail tube protein [Amycolatopsis palatopharyngis]|uniref:phage tail tube protein n=1 Tax=Amycolatopsis palatopharyngis TaxID=187982 RepID=UPI000E287B14|nr:hypothetical protein [Amycolatopsis palatopharyngis]
MPATTKVPLGASTTTRKWYLDVNTGTDATPTWVGVHGITEFKPAMDPTLQDDSDYDSEGYKSQTKTAEEWAVEAKVVRKVTAADATAYDPGQEFLRTKSVGKFGVANSAQIRYYEMEPGGPRVEAYKGNAAVTWSPEGGAMDELDMVSVTLTGQGKLEPITHPDTV